jgi:hypothetical protein
MPANALRLAPPRLLKPIVGVILTESFECQGDLTPT